MGNTTTTTAGEQVEQVTPTVAAGSVAERTGIDVDTIASFDHLSTQSFQPGCTIAPGGETIVGLCYMTDFDATQEYGIAELRTAITSNDPRQFQMIRAARTKICRFTDVTAIALSQSSLPATAKWGDTLTGIPNDSRYTNFYAQTLPHTQGIDAYPRLWNLNVDGLRAEIRAAGHTGTMPRRRAELEALWLTYQTATRPYQWPAYFDGGRTLVLRADSGPAAKVLEALCDAAERGTLGIGNGSGPFSTGVFLYDTNDETVELIEEREAAFDWHDARMAELKPITEQLRAAGHRFYFCGRPRTIRDDQGAEKVVYWLNGSGGHGYPQPYGWYSLEELAAEQFVDDAKARKR